MPCSVKLRPQDTPLDRARYVHEHLAPNLFRAVAGPGTKDPATVAWRLSPQPFPLAPKTVAALATLGGDLLKLYRAVNRLYFMSVRGTAPNFIHEYLDHGKPEHIVRLERQNRFKSDVPSLIRPDIILTDDGMIASELDSIPGGMGFVGAMGAVYCELGFDQVGEFDGIVRGFARMLQSLSGKDQPTVAIVVSPESEDYRGEMAWLADALRASGLAQAVTVFPEEVVFTEEALVVDTPSGRRPDRRRLPWRDGLACRRAASKRTCSSGDSLSRGSGLYRRGAGSRHAIRASHGRRPLDRK